MASSSDWLAALAAPPSLGAAPAPQWLARLEAQEVFRAALPFAEPEPLAPPCPAPEGPAIDPLAELAARAFAEGEAAGRAAAEAEAAARGLRQRALRLAFRALDEAARDVLAQDLAATVLALAEGVLGEAAIDRAGLLARCRAAARRIGGAAGTLALHLHPDDAALVGAGTLDGWQVVEDPALDRGALRVEGPDSSVSDGPEEWRRAIAAAVQG